MARPKKVINPATVESLAAINCTMDEISAVIGCDKRTLERRFADIIKKGRENGRSSLRRMMYEKAKQGNVTMMIWLSKNMLGYTDKVEQKVQATTNVVRKAQWKNSSNSTNPIPNNSNSISPKPDIESPH